MMKIRRTLTVTVAVVGAVAAMSFGTPAQAQQRGAATLASAPDVGSDAVGGISELNLVPTAEDVSGGIAATDAPGLGALASTTLATLGSDAADWTSLADGTTGQVLTGRPWLRLRIIHHALRTAADRLGMTPQELLAALRDGQTVKDLADAKGVALDDIVAAVLQPVVERLDTAVDKGRLTRDEADAIVTRLTDALTSRFSNPLPAPGARRPGPGHPGGPGGPGGPDRP
jgi:hypothetical protein